MVSITIFPSAGWLAIEYALKQGSVFTIFKLHNPNLSHSDLNLSGPNGSEGSGSILISFLKSTVSSGTST